MLNKEIKNIIEAIKELKGDLKQVWVSNNCIFAELKTEDGDIEKKLYTGNKFDFNVVYQVFHRLIYTLNFNGMLKNDNILI